MTTTRVSASASCWSTKLRRFRSRRSTPTIRSAPWCASASRSMTRPSIPRSTASAARSSGLRDRVGGLLLLALFDRPRQEPGGRNEEQNDQDEQPARCLGQRGGSFFLGFVTDHEDLVVRAFGRLADQSALLHLAKHKGRNVACKHVLLAPVGRI